MPLLDQSVSGSEAITQSGIVPAHAKAFQQLCKDLGWFVIFRGVNPDATPLIADNYPTKDMGVHGKSSNWGPQAGFICLNQFFSKVVKDGEQKVLKANQESPLSLDHGYPAVPLLVSDTSIQDLLKRQKIKSHDPRTNQVVAQVPNHPKPHAFELVPVTEESLQKVADAMAALRFVLKEPAGKVVTNPLTTREDLEQYLNNLLATISSLAPPSGAPANSRSHLYFVKTDTNPEAYPSWYAGVPGEFLFVLASTGEGRFSRQVAEMKAESRPPSTRASGDDRFSLPLTADYDIFAICPPLSHLASSSLKRPSNWDTLKASRKARFRWALLAEQALQIRKLQLTDEWGAVTRYHLYGLLRLNEAAKDAGYRGGFVCHHGTEQENVFYGEVDEVYAVFSPSGRIYAVPPTHLEFFLDEISLLGHVFYTNPSYVRTNDARFVPESFSKRRDGDNGFEKKPVKSYRLDGKQVRENVDAIFYYNRHNDTLFRMRQERDKLHLLLTYLVLESPVDPAKPGPISGFDSLEQKWADAIEMTSAPGGHKRVKKLGIHSPPLPMSEVREIDRFVKWAKEDPRRLISLQALLERGGTRDA
jgi:hypothetical protein